jgi:hypothetical protein
MPTIQRTFRAKGIQPSLREEGESIYTTTGRVNPDLQASGFGSGMFAKKQL